MNRVRLERVEITNFKNVRHGIVDLSKGHNADTACSVLGLYGQNGSGKTTLIDSLQILKYLLSPIPCCQQGEVQEWIHSINVGATSSELAWTFRIDCDNGNGHWVEYGVTLQQCEDCFSADKAGQFPRVQFVNEKITVTSLTNGGKGRKTVLIDTGSDAVFKPASKLRALVSVVRTAKEDLIVAKGLARERARSFVFSREFAGVLEKAEVEEFRLLRDILLRLCYYGQYGLFVVKTNASGLISLNALPISFTYEQPQCKTTGSILIPLNEDALVAQKEFETVQILIKHMNVVLCKLVPGLTIDLKKIGSQLFPDGSTGIRVQFVSNKNAQEIPLKYESEGIKKIISVLHLLIEVYNKPSTTVAIDELDSGVFEYLLGELLQIIANRGKGQLIFTSHNLRPLETLNRDMIAFTTTNPDNRYVRLRNVKSNNNLRDFYYRDIVLGGQAEEMYSRTDNSEIAYAFMSAGEMMSGAAVGGEDVR